MSHPTTLGNLHSDRDSLEAALAESMSALAKAVADAGRTDADRGEAGARVEKARIRCRQLRAALVHPGDSEPIARNGAWIDAPMGRSDRQSVHVPIARAIESRSGIRPLERARKAAPLLRQAIDLLALTLAFLQYYFLDVQLEILLLPSIWWTLVTLN